MLTDLVSGEDLLPGLHMVVPSVLPWPQPREQRFVVGERGEEDGGEGRGSTGDGGGGGEREKYVSFLKELTPFTRAPPL